MILRFSYKVLWLLPATVFILLRFASETYAQSLPAPAQARALAQIRALETLKARRTPLEHKIDSQLLFALALRRTAAFRKALPQFQARVPLDKNNHVLVEIRGGNQSTLNARLKANGAQIGRAFSGQGEKMLRARLLLEKIEVIAAAPDVRFIGLPLPPRTRSSQMRSSQMRLAQMRSTLSVSGPQPRLTPTATPPAATPTPATGAVVTEGDVTHEANVVRQRFRITGKNVKIGVLSDSVDYLEESQEAGELGEVTVLPGQSGLGVGNTGEGTAMLEIIHDLVPDAQLFFATAYSGKEQFAKNIRDLRRAGCDIIVDDVFYLDESPFEYGPVARAIRDVTQAGALYFSAAGNNGNKNDGTSGTWEGNFRPVERIKTGTPHNWGRGSLNPLSSSSRGQTVTLQWADRGGASRNDYDLYLIDFSGQIIGASNNSQTGTQDPFESFFSGNTQQSFVMATLFRGQARFLRLVSYEGRLGQNTPGSVADHNGIPECVSIAAVDASTSYPAPFRGGSANPVEPFSSDGPRRLFFDYNGASLNGTTGLAPGGKNIPKPDLSAADGVSTSVPFFRTFFGTSAAAPHAAALAGLLKSYNPGLSNTQIRRALSASASDIEAPGFDRDSGYGIINAPRAIAILSSEDSKPPLISITTPSLDGRLSTLERIRGTVSDTGGSGLDRVELFLVRERDGRYWSGRNWSENQIALQTRLSGSAFALENDLPAGLNLQYGDYDIFATAIDRAGNRNTAHTSFHVSDLQAPEVTVTRARTGSNGVLDSLEGTLVDEVEGSGPNLVVAFLRRVSDGHYWSGREWVRSPVELSTELKGQDHSVTWILYRTLPDIAPALGSDVYRITIVGFDKGGNRDTTTYNFVARAAPTATR
ncbi:MAG: hypothetical protein JWN98_1818 [Abditibacteriota bacterium]|nr:hypothetical protein [Abditibacteriota bacterium]